MNYTKKIDCFVVSLPRNDDQRYTSLRAKRGSLVLFFIFHLFIFSFSSVGAKAPTEEDVLDKILDTDSPFFYEPLMERYEAGDETLTADDYHYLYYGWAYQPTYDATAAMPGTEAMTEIFQRTATPSKDDAMKIIEAGKLNMEVDPFSPSNLNMMTWAYEIAGDSVGMRASVARFRGVIGAIQSSGSGLKKRSPWWAVRSSHVDDIVAMRGLKFLYWEPWGFKIERKKNKWEFNGIPIN